MNKLLVVHKDAGIAYLLQQIIQTESTEVHTASSFEEVETKSQSHEFDVVVTDISVDGIFTNLYIDFLNKKYANAALIIVSDMDQPKLIKETESLGVEAFIGLPLDTQVLNATISKYLN